MRSKLTEEQKRLLQQQDLENLIYDIRPLSEMDLRPRFSFLQDEWDLTENPDGSFLVTPKNKKRPRRKPPTPNAS